MIANTGGPAFPSDHDNEYGYPAKGMTLRDYFAAKAMQGILADPSGNPSVDYENIAKYAYRLADEMLKARTK